MDWGEILRAAWRGEVPDADLRASLAATAGLAPLQQALDDRLLAARIENPSQDWRAILAVGRIAAPLWLAGALVTVAGVFFDAASAPRAGRPPASMDAGVHDLIASLLAPVEDLAAATSAALADASRRPFLVAPLHIGPSGEITTPPAPNPPYAVYLRGLAKAARDLHTTVAAALAATRATIGTTAPPDWLTAGFQGVDAALKAAGTRLDMAEVRLGALERPDGAAGSGTLCHDYWTILDTALVSGQTVADPHLLPGARSTPTNATPTNATPTPRMSSPPAPSPSRPRAQPHPAFALPQVAEGAPTASDRPISAQPASGTMATPARDITLPIIGAPPGGAAPTPMPAPNALPTIATASPGALPTIGAPADSPPRSEHTHSTPASSVRSATGRDAASGTASKDGEGSAPFVLPEIG